MFRFLKKSKGSPEPPETTASASGPRRGRPLLQLYGAELDQETTLARELLAGRGLPYSYVDVTHDDTTRNWLRKKTGSTTLPRLFIDQFPIGDYGALREIEYRGDLDRLLSGELHPESLKVEKADAEEDLSGRDAETLRQRLRQGEILGLTLPDGSSFDTWAEVFANPPQIFYEGVPYPIEEMDRIAGEIAGLIAKGATFTWREED